MQVADRQTAIAERYDVMLANGERVRRIGGLKECKKHTEAYDDEHQKHTQREQGAYGA